jgi:hypothetical protein
VPSTAAGADADADGLPNLVDYATGGSLLAPDPAPAADHDAGALRLHFTRDTRVVDVTLQVEAASTLGPAAWAVVAENIGGAGWTGSATVIESAPDAFGRVRVTASDPGSGTQRFMRLRAVHLP